MARGRYEVAQARLSEALGNLRTDRRRSGMRAERIYRPTTVLLRSSKGEVKGARGVRDTVAVVSIVTILCMVYVCTRMERGQLNVPDEIGTRKGS